MIAISVFVQGPFWIGFCAGVVALAAASLSAVWWLSVGGAWGPKL